jgi:hypothetical protein
MPGMSTAATGLLAVTVALLAASTAHAQYPANKFLLYAWAGGWHPCCLGRRPS